MELKGKNALVCGSSQGIGLATAKLMARRGANITLLARDEGKLRKVVNELSSTDGQVHSYLVADFSDPSSLKEMINAKVLDGLSIDILINNTGGPKGGPIVSAEVEEFLSAFNQHLICNHILVQALYPYMKSQKWGRIINVISTSVKQPLANLGVSNTVRGAVANWSKTMANELGQFNITVNNVLPGATNTSRLSDIAKTKADKTGSMVNEVFSQMASESPMKRIAEPEEVAEAISFLASDRASYINGINVPVDGGRTKSL